MKERTRGGEPKKVEEEEDSSGEEDEEKTREEKREGERRREKEEADLCLRGERVRAGSSLGSLGRMEAGMVGASNLPSFVLTRRGWPGTDSVERTRR